MAELTTMVVVSMDGSQNAMRSLDYVDFMFGPKHHLEVNLLSSGSQRKPSQYQSR